MDGSLGIGQAFKYTIILPDSTVLVEDQLEKHTHDTHHTRLTIMSMKMSTQANTAVFELYLTLSVMRVEDWVWVQTAKHTGVKQQKALEAKDLGKEVLLLIIVHGGYHT